MKLACHNIIDYCRLVTSSSDLTAEAWRSCLADSRIVPDKHGLGVIYPYRDGPDSPDEHFYVDVPRKRFRVCIPASSADQLLAACEGWVKSADGPIANPGELWTPLMMNIARVKAGEISQSKAESLFFKGGFVNSIVVLPIGGVFSREEPIVIGSNCVLGHISRETESAIDALAQSATPPLLGFHLNNDVEWTQEFLDAEADEYVAEAIEEELMESAGWMPLLMAIKLKAVGTTASIWAIDVAQVLAGALWLASLDDNFSDRSYPVAPWICGGDGPVKPYDLEGYTFNPTQTLRTDLTNARPDLPEGDKWYTYPHASPVSIEDVIEAGWIPAILRVVEAALSESRCVEDISVARSCQFIYTSLHATSWAMRDHLQLLAARSLDAKTFDLSLKESCFASFGLPEAPFGAASIAAVRNALKNMK